MPLGPGKYDDILTTARLAAGPTASAALIVLDGKLGSGFSTQMSAEHLVRLPDVLETMAKEIRSNLSEGRL